MLELFKQAPSCLPSELHLILWFQNYKADRKWKGLEIPNVFASGLILFACFETGSYVLWVSLKSTMQSRMILELLILPHPPPECWDFKCLLPYPNYVVQGIDPMASYVVDKHPTNSPTLQTQLPKIWNVLDAAEWHVKNSYKGQLDIKWIIQ